MYIEYTPTRRKTASFAAVIVTCILVMVSSILPTINGAPLPPTIKPILPPSPTFSNIIDLNNDAGFSLEPRMASSGEKIFVVWTKLTQKDPNTGQYLRDIIFRKSTDGGFSFDNAVVLKKNIYGGSMRIATAGDNVYILWVEPEFANNVVKSNKIFLMKSIDGGTTFGNAIAVPSNTIGPLARSADLAVSGKNLYIAFTSGNSQQGYQVLLMKSIDGGTTFGNAVPISPTQALSFQRLVVYSNNVYISWYNAINKNILFRKSTDGGNNFGNTFNLYPGPIGSIPDIIAYGNNLYAVRSNDSAIFIKRSIDGGTTFDNEKIISANRKYAGSPEVAAIGNNVYVLWTQTVTQFSPASASDIFFRKSTNGGATFSGTLNLSNNVGKSVLGDLTLYGNNAVGVVWQDSGPSDYGKDYNVLFRASPPPTS